MNPNVKYELWVIKMHHCRFVSSKKCTVLAGVFNNEEGFISVGIRGIGGKSLYLPLNFPVNLKLLKIKVIKKENIPPNIFLFTDEFYQTFKKNYFNTTIVGIPLSSLTNSCPH